MGSSPPWYSEDLLGAGYFVQSGFGLLDHAHPWRDGSSDSPQWLGDGPSSDQLPLSNGPPFGSRGPDVSAIDTIDQTMLHDVKHDSQTEVYPDPSSNVNQSRESQRALHT